MRPAVLCYPVLCTCSALPGLQGSRAGGQLEELPAGSLGPQQEPAGYRPGAAVWQEGAQRVCCRLLLPHERTAGICFRYGLYLLPFNQFLVACPCADSQLTDP